MRVMSHWTVARLKLKNPDIEILKKALEAIAQELGSRVEENMLIWGYRHQRQCQLAIPLNLPYGNGYGVYINEEGEVEVVVDDHGAPMTAQQFANKLMQYYTAIAITQVAPQLGFNIENIQQTNEGILIDLAR